MAKLISTKRAMQILGVGSTTIKRWADENKLPALKTVGGHRRFRLEDVESLLQHSVPPAPEALVNADTWFEILDAHRDVQEVRDAIFQLHKRFESWYRVADFLGEVLANIGARWANNQISIAEEHLATGLLDYALSSITASFHVPKMAPTCLLAAPTGEKHTLGLSLVRACLCTAGFRTLWMGAETPFDEIVASIHRIKPASVLLSASPWMQDHGSLQNGCVAVESACKDEGSSLILGGRGAWPESTHYAHRCQTFDELRLTIEALGHQPG